MSNTFSLQRFSLLFRQHWGQNGNRYLLSILSLAAILIGFFALIILMGDPILVPGLQAAVYFIGLFLAGALFAGNIFSPLSSQTKGTTYLLLPASQFEKLLLSLLVGILFFYLAYTVAYYGVDWLMLKFADSIRLRHWKAEHGTAAGFEFQHLFHLYKLEAYRQGITTNNHFPYIHLAFLAMQSAYIAGSVYFGKYAFVKTTISLLVIGSLFTLYIAKILPLLQPSEVAGQFPLQWRLYNDEVAQQWRYVKLPEWISDLFLFSLKFLIAPILWLAAYLRLKEKQI